MKNGPVHGHLRSRFMLCEAGLQPAFQPSDEFTRFAINDAQVNRKLIGEAGITAR